MLRRIYWGDLAVPFVFACIVLSGHFGYLWLLLGFVMIVLSYVFAVKDPTVFTYGFKFPTAILHFLIGIGISGLILFFIKCKIIVFVLLVILAISYEVVQGRRTLIHFRYIDTWLDILGTLVGGTLMIILK